MNLNFFIAIVTMSQKCNSIQMVHRASHSQILLHYEQHRLAEQPTTTQILSAFIQTLDNMKTWTILRQQIFDNELQPKVGHCESLRNISNKRRTIQSWWTTSAPYHTHVYIHTYIHTYIYTCTTHIYTYTYIYIYIYVCVCVCVRVCVCVQILHIIMYEHFRFCNI